MKTHETARKTAYVGMGAGLVLFVVVGLLAGSLVGGVIGLNIAGGLFGAPVSSALLPRLIVGMAMLTGILISAVAFIAGSGTAGWLIGCAIDSVRAPRNIEAAAKN